MNRVPAFVLQTATAGLLDFGPRVAHGDRKGWRYGEPANRAARPTAARATAQRALSFRTTPQWSLTMKTIDLAVQGMSCGSCVNHITQALKPVAGVDDVAVDLQSGHVRVSGTFDAGVEHLVSTLADAGYPAKLADTSASKHPSSTTSQRPRAARGGCCCG